MSPARLKGNTSAIWTSGHRPGWGRGRDDSETPEGNLRGRRGRLQSSPGGWGPHAPALAQDDLSFSTFPCHPREPGEARQRLLGSPDSRAAARTGRALWGLCVLRGPRRSPHPALGPQPHQACIHVPLRLHHPRSRHNQTPRSVEAWVSILGACGCSRPPASVHHAQPARPQGMHQSGLGGLELGCGGRP